MPRSPPPAVAQLVLVRSMERANNNKQGRGKIHFSVPPWALLVIAVVFWLTGIYHHELGLAGTVLIGSASGFLLALLMFLPHLRRLRRRRDHSNS